MDNCGHDHNDDDFAKAEQYITNEKRKGTQYKFVQEYELKFKKKFGAEVATLGENLVNRMADFLEVKSGV